MCRPLLETTKRASYTCARAHANGRCYVRARCSRPGTVRGVFGSRVPTLSVGAGGCVVRERIRRLILFLKQIKVDVDRRARCPHVRVAAALFFGAVPLDCALRAARGHGAKPAHVSVGYSNATGSAGQRGKCAAHRAGRELGRSASRAGRPRPGRAVFVSPPTARGLPAPAPAQGKRVHTNRLKPAGTHCTSGLMPKKSGALSCSVQVSQRPQNRGPRRRTRATGTSPGTCSMTASKSACRSMGRGAEWFGRHTQAPSPPLPHRRLGPSTTIE